MSKSIYFMLLAALLSTSFRRSLGHGRLLEPPARNSLWRFPDQFPEAVPDYDDNGLNCGGRSYQHFEVGGKCGICGDKWIPDSTEPRPREAGGKYAKGIIARHYSPGSVINVTIQVTASHKGYFQFRLCPNNDVTKPATHDCLNEHLLRFEDGSTKFYYGSTVGYYHMRVRLPSNVTCSQCVFQWKWITGNSWGVSPSGEGCVGCGPQEEFYGCSDISIGDTPGSAGADPVLNDPEVDTNNDHNPTTTVRVSDPEGWTTAEVVGGDGSKCRPTELYANTAEILRGWVTTKGQKNNDNDSATLNGEIVNEDRGHNRLNNETEMLEWSSRSQENTAFVDASRVDRIGNYRNHTQSSPSEQLYRKQDGNKTPTPDEQLTVAELNPDDFLADTRQQVNGPEVTSYDEEISATERLLRERFEKKTSQMKHKLSSKLRHDPLPVQVFTGKRLLTKLLRVPGSGSEEARKLIADMAVSGMAAQRNVNEAKLTEVRRLVETKLSQLAEQLKYRGNTNKENLGAMTTQNTPPITAVTTATDTTSKVETAATADHHLHERVLSADVITNISHVMPVIDLSSDEDYSHVLHNGSFVFDLRCRDRLTGVRYQRYMIKLTNHYMIGYLTDYISDYVVLSVGVTNPKSFRYVFVLPLTVLANRRIGFGSIVILVSPVDNYINNLGLRHVLSRLCQLGAVVIFLPASEKNTASVSQTSRIFIANILLGIYDELRGKGFAVSRPDNKYLVVSDSDIWPLKRSTFSVPRNASILARPSSKNRPIEEDGRLYFMYPLSGTGMRATVWHDVLTTYGRVPRDLQVTADHIVQVFVDRFGQIANKTTRRNGREESWFLDQRFLSAVVQNYLDEHGEGSVFILENWKPRIDKQNWPAADRITQELVDNAKEVHVIPAGNGEKWRQLTPLLEKMYGAHSEEYSWCLDYYDEYTEKSAYLTTGNITWA